MEKSSLTYDTGDILCKKYVNGHNRYFLVTEQMDTSHIKCIDLDDEWRSVVDKGSGEVDVLFGYFIVVDREFAKAVGANPSAKYYRNADLEFSLAMREAGGRLIQIELPLIQERHHGYHDVDSAYREKNSKENYQRLLKRFRGNLGILAPRR